MHKINLDQAQMLDQSSGGWMLSVVPGEGAWWRHSPRSEYALPLMAPAKQMLKTIFAFFL